MISQNVLSVTLHSFNNVQILTVIREHGLELLISWHFARLGWWKSGGTSCSIGGEWGEGRLHRRVREV